MTVHANSLENLQPGKYLARNGRAVGATNKKTLIAREWAEEIIGTCHKTGKQLKPYQIKVKLARWAEHSDSTKRFLLEHCQGRPIETVRHLVEGFEMIEPEAIEAGTAIEIDTEDQGCSPSINREQGLEQDQHSKIEGDDGRDKYSL